MEFRRWDRFAGALADGEVDAIWCGSAITDERRKVFSYSRPYAAIDEAVLVRADSGIHSLADLRGRSVGAIVASTNMRLAESFGAAELVGFDGSSDDVFAEMVAAVESGAVDAMVDDEPAFGAQLASGAFRIAHVAETQNAWGAACRLGDRRRSPCSTTASPGRSRAARWPTCGAAGSARNRCRRHRRLTVGPYPRPRAAQRAVCVRTRADRVVSRDPRAFRAS